MIKNSNLQLNDVYEFKFDKEKDPLEVIAAENEIFSNYREAEYNFIQSSLNLSKQIEHFNVKMKEILDCPDYNDEIKVKKTQKVLSSNQTKIMALEKDLEEKVKILKKF